MLGGRIGEVGYGNQDELGGMNEGGDEGLVKLRYCIGY